MATFTLYQPMDMATNEVWFGDVITATSTQITIYDGFRTGTYLGNFYYDSYGNLIGGTATGYQYSEGGVLQSVLGNANADALTVMSYLYSLDQQGLQAYVFRSDDTMTGSSFADGLFHRIEWHH